MKDKSLEEILKDLDDYAVDIPINKYKIAVSQNGWECTGHVLITCNQIKPINKRKLMADNVTIEFDEDIGEISLVDENYELW